MLHPLQTKGKSTGCDRLRRWCWPWSWIKTKMERCLAKWFHELSFFTDLQCFLIYFIDFYRSVWFKIQTACLRWLKCRPFQNSSWAVSTSMSGPAIPRVGQQSTENHGRCIYPNSTWNVTSSYLLQQELILNKMYEFEEIMIVAELSIYHQIVSRYQSFARLTPSVMRRVL